MGSGQKKNKNKVSIWAVGWLNAKYYFNDLDSMKEPEPNLLVGAIIDINDKFVHIANPFEYDNKTGDVILNRGYLIPRKAITQLKKVDDFYVSK